MAALWLLWLAGCGLCFGGCRPRDAALPAASPTGSPTATPALGVPFVTVAPPTAVLIQTTPTPLPTATATPTATPIVYVIQEGDTLLALAWPRGNNVDDILALNPGVVPERLQIGQAVVLPPPATPLAQQSAGTPVPLAVVVTQIHAYRTPVGSLWLVGEVQNQGERPAEAVQLEISLLDAGGGLLGAAAAWVAVPIIPSGARAPFGVLVAEPPAAFATPAVAIVGGQSVTDLGTRYLDLSAAGQIVTAPSGQLQVQGEVRNEGVETAVSLLLVAALYDADDQISGYAQRRFDTGLRPGDNRTFAFDVAPPGGVVTAVQLMAVALREDGASD